MFYATLLVNTKVFFNLQKNGENYGKERKIKKQEKY